MHQPRLPLLRGMEPALVADDRVILGPRQGRIVARAPAAIAGLIEIRGVGVERVPFQAEAEIRLIVDLVPVGSRPRLPPDPLPRERLSGVEAAVIALAPFEASAAAKLTLAMLKFA
jgi:serine kinase of HPr protein (carbohydrate metabolism regulator)